MNISQPSIELALLLDVEYRAVLKAANCIGSSPPVSMSIHLGMNNVLACSNSKYVGIVFDLICIATPTFIDISRDLEGSNSHGKQFLALAVYIGV